MSRGPRFVLAAILALFVWMTLSGWSSDSTSERVFAGVFAGFMILIIIAVLFPSRSMIPLRIVAGIVAASCISYFVFELLELLRGEPQRLRIGEPSTFMAGLALLVFGIPALVFALGGETVGWLQKIFRQSEEGKSRGDRTV